MRRCSAADCELVAKNGKREGLETYPIMYVLWRLGQKFTPLFDNYEDTPRFGTCNFVYFLHDGRRSIRYPSVYEYPGFIHESAMKMDIGHGC